MPRRVELAAEPLTRADRVRLQLASEIIAGKHRPGTRLDEVAHSNRLGVSRTPLREAVRQLVSLGLVENRPHRGVVVADRVSQALFETLAEMEAVCARLAAERMDAEQRLDLARLVAEDGDWRGAVHRGARNTVLAGLAETLWQPLTAGAGGMAVEVSRRLGRQVAAAIADGDGDAAAAAMEEFVNAVARAFAAPARQRRGGDTA